MNSVSTLHILLKLGQKEHMNALYEKGEIYMQTASYFRSIEENADGRGDKHECVSEYYSANSLNNNKFTLIHPKFAPIELSKEDGTRFVTIDYHCPDKTNIYSLCYTNFNIIKSKNSIISDLNFADEKDYVVLIHNPKEFISRILKEINKTTPFAYASKVEYIDECNFGGEVGFFKKFQKYEHQSEFRIVAQFNDSAVRKFYIGSISDIAIHPISKEDFLKIKINIKNNG